MKNFKLRRFFDKHDDECDCEHFKAEYIKNSIWFIYKKMKGVWHRYGDVKAASTAKTEDIFDDFFSLIGE